MKVAEARSGVIAKEIADATGIALPTTYHLLNTLVDERLLEKDSQRRYVLGGSIGILAHSYLQGKTVPQYMLSALQRLADATEETVYLAAWGERDIRVLATVEGKQVLRVAEATAGVYENAHARGCGKVLLAYAGPDLRSDYLRLHPLQRLTPATICDPDQFEAELDRIRKRGIAYDNEEFASGVSCVAAPLLDEGRIVASFGVSVPSKRFKARRVELTQILQDVISEGMREALGNSSAD